MEARPEENELLSMDMKQAQRKRLATFVRLSRSIQRHWNGVVAIIRTRVTYGAMESPSLRPLTPTENSEEP